MAQLTKKMKALKLMQLKGMIPNEEVTLQDWGKQYYLELKNSLTLQD